MPLYEYLCLSCNCRFSAVRRMEERRSPLPCRACGGEEVELLLSSFSVLVRQPPWSPWSTEEGRERLQSLSRPPWAVSH
jgi:putative FmdB family regulatory protein